MADVTINYEGNAIATMSASGTKTLLTEGKYCTDDIEVVYVSPGGGGGGITEVSGSFTVVSDSDTMYITGLGGTPKVIKWYIHDNAFDGISKILGGYYAYGPNGITQTNGAGTGGGNVYLSISGEMSSPTVLADNTDPGNDKTIASTTGFSIKDHASSWKFRTGYTYDYVVLY